MRDADLWEADAARDALERLVADKGITDAATLARYQHAWDHAADRTPHGEPIELTPDDFHHD